MKRGDSFELHCWFDNPDRKVVHHGVSNGDEMCGPLLMYSPHDPGANDGGNMAYASGGRRRMVQVDDGGRAGAYVDAAMWRGEVVRPTTTAAKRPPGPVVADDEVR